MSQCLSNGCVIDVFFFCYVILQRVMKRFDAAGGDASHGCSKAQRTIGSTGQRDAPGKVCVETAS